MQLTYGRLGEWLKARTAASDLPQPDRGWILERDAENGTDRGSRHRGDSFECERWSLADSLRLLEHHYGAEPGDRTIDLVELEKGIDGLESTVSRDPEQAGATL